MKLGKKQHLNLMTRREFISASSKAAMVLASSSPLSRAADLDSSRKIPVCGHLWVYASRFRAPFDCSAVLEEVFADLKYAGIEGVELMEVELRHDDAVDRIQSLIQKYHLPVSGSSYGADLWDKDKHAVIKADVELVVGRLHALGGRTFGISVGNAGHVKTPAELDAQARILEKVMDICAQHAVVPNLHNHTYEVENNLHDLRGTLSRIPDIKLGPDLNWLIRGGVDPVQFIDQYGDQIVYLHLRDQRADGQWTEALGEGATDFKAIAKALQRNHFKGTAAIELAFPAHFTPVRPLKEDWKISREFVRTTFGW
jgi:sugar phosphate isomerase/epimerase